MASRYYVILLLAFMVTVPYVVWKTIKWNEEQQSWGCGTVTPRSMKQDADSVAVELFHSNCASCHHPLKDATGPALLGILDSRPQGFLYRFLVKRNSLKKDSLTRQRIKDYVIECLKFPEMSKEDANRLEGFIRRQQSTIP